MADKVLVVDVGGTNVKILAAGEKESRKFPSGATMTPRQMVVGVKKLAGDWNYDAVSIGYPGLVSKGRIAVEPHNLAPGWVKFDFEAAFKCPVKIMNDAAMQALGSYNSGLLLFMGLGSVPLRDRHLVKGSVLLQPGIADENIHGSHFLDGCGEHRLHFGFARDVRLNSDRSLTPLSYLVDNSRRVLRG